MKANRRRFLGMLGAAPIAAPAVAEAIAETTQAGVAVQAEPTDPERALGRWISANSSNCARYPTQDEMQIALQIPGVRDELRSMLFARQERRVQLDPDIDVHRSFSLAAKIAYQRQRNVEGSLARMTETPWSSSSSMWDRVTTIVFKALGIPTGEEKKL